MSESVKLTKAEGKQKRLANLRPFKKGDKNIPKSPGRPRIPDWVKEFAEFTSTGQRPVQLYQRLLKKYPVDAMHYLAGKPVERIDLSGELKHSVDPNLIAAAQVLVSKL